MQAVNRPLLHKGRIHQMFLAAILSAALAAPASDPSATEVTIYNQGFGLVKETRSIDFKEGRQTVAIEDVASQIQPDSVGFRSLTAPKGMQVLEQNYQFDLISTAAILNKSVGKRIRLTRAFGNQLSTIEGVLLSAPTAIVPDQNGNQNMTYNGMVIRTDDGQIVLDPVGEVSVREVPEGLISKPTLLWDLISERAGTNQVELSYITNGIQWDAAYVLTLQGTNDLADLQGWVTVNNQSGATFRDAKMKLLAGEVNQAPRGGRGMGGGGMAPMEALKSADAFAEQSLFEYHLYTLQRPATIRNREIKQLALLEGHDLKVVKRLIMDSLQGYGSFYPSEGQVGTGVMSPQVRVEFMNTKENGLGMPLPQGKFKVYQRDNSGSVQMLGEDQIRHTPRNEKLSILVGKSFDIVGERKRTNFERVSANSVRETFEIQLRNRKEVADTVVVLERHWGDWKVTQTTDKWTKADANTMEFDVALKANEVRTVRYTVETKW